MPSIIIAEADGKYNVLVNYIQEGVSYSTREHAEKEAKKLKDKYGSFHNK